MTETDIAVIILYLLLWPKCEIGFGSVMVMKIISIFSINIIQYDIIKNVCGSEFKMDNSIGVFNYENQPHEGVMLLKNYKLWLKNVPWTIPVKMSTDPPN